MALSLQDRPASTPRDVRRANLSLKNRLQSIIHDWKFVQTLVENERCPIVPNERCGLWYVPLYQDTAYFKSTDGHNTQWTFSMRRLNLHLLPLLATHQEIAIIDSSRRKLLPDSLLKTVPIWCAVLNSILYQDITDDRCLKRELEQSGILPCDLLFDVIVTMFNNNWLYTEIISEKEEQQIQQRIPEFASKAQQLGLLSRDKLYSLLGKSRKPIIPSFYYQDETTRLKEINDKVYRVHCVATSSGKTLSGLPTLLTVNDLKNVSWIYIQGAADDHELWTADLGELSPGLFWNCLYYCEGKLNEELVDKTTGYLIQDLSDTDLHNAIKQVHTEDQQPKAATALEFISIGKELIWADLTLDQIPSLKSQFRLLQHIVIFSSEDCDQEQLVENSRVHFLPLENSKRGSKELRQVLPRIVGQLGTPSPQNTILVLGDMQNQQALGIMLCLLCLHFDDEIWQLLDKTPTITKNTVKRHLAKLNDKKRINPSRSTLQSVHSFLMSGPATKKH